MPGRSTAAQLLIGLPVAVAGGAWGLHWLSVIEASDHGRLSDPVDFAVIAILACYAQIPAHELGHLLAAWLMGVRVTGIRVLGFRIGKVSRSGSWGMVGIRPVPGPLISLRLAVVTIGGPLANVALTAVFATRANDLSRAVAVRGGLAIATVFGVMLIVINLVPMPGSSGLHSDGSNLLRRLLHPGQVQDQLVAVRDLTVPRAGSATESADLDRLRAAVDDPRPAVAMRAVAVLARAHAGPEGRLRKDGLWAAAPFLARFADRADVPARSRADAVAGFAFLLAYRYLSQLGAAATDPSSEQARWIAHLAELAYRADPESVPARSSLGLARLIQNRPGEARAVMLGAAIGQAPSAGAQARALTVRGWAEFELGDTAQARRLAKAALRADSSEGLARALMQRVRADPGAGGFRIGLGNQP